MSVDPFGDVNLVTTRRDFMSRALLSAAALGAPSFMRPDGANASLYPARPTLNNPPVFELEELDDW
jgi:hypothetical protein